MLEFISIQFNQSIIFLLILSLTFRVLVANPKKQLYNNTEEKPIVMLYTYYIIIINRHAETPGKSILVHRALIRYRRFLVTYCTVILPSTFMQ